MRNLVITTAIVFIINLVMQILTDYLFTATDGEILVSEPIKIDSTNYSQVLILVNFKKKTINNIDFSITDGKINNILLSGDKVVIGEKSLTKFRIEKVYPNSTATIFLQLRTHNSKVPHLTSLNHEDIDFALRQPNEFKKPYQINWIDVLVKCTAISIIFGFFTHYFEQRIGDFKKETKHLRDQVKLQDEKSLNLKKRIDNLSNTYTKLRLLLLKQIQDLKIENKFYRKLILIIGEKVVGKMDPENFQNLITENLKTFSVNSEIEKHAKEIDIIASIVQFKSKEDENLNK